MKPALKQERDLLIEALRQTQTDTDWMQSYNCFVFDYIDDELAGIKPKTYSMSEIENAIVAVCDAEQVDPGLKTALIAGLKCCL